MPFYYCSVISETGAVGDMKHCSLISLGLPTVIRMRYVLNIIRNILKEVWAPAKFSVALIISPLPSIVSFCWYFFH